MLTHFLYSQFKSFVISGEVLFKLHADDLKTEIQNILYDLVKERLPQWKQMRALEVISAIIAETLIEMRVLIFAEPPEVHWPNGLVSKLAVPVRGKKSGKQTQKQKHGVFGDLVSKLAPTIPDESSSQNKTKVATKGRKSFKTPTKVQKTASTSVAVEVDETANANGGAGNCSVSDAHQGIPALGRRGQSYEMVPHLIIPLICHKFWKYYSL